VTILDIESRIERAQLGVFSPIWLAIIYLIRNRRVKEKSRQ